jgi:hypothetical protein
MPAESVKYIGDKLVVGQLDYSFLPLVPAIPGSSILNGPVWIGSGGPPIPTANCMIGPGLHPITLQITGITNVIGVVNRSAITNVTGLTSKVGATVRSALSATSGVNVKSALNTGSSINVFNSVVVDKTCVATKFIGDITATAGLNPQMTAVKALAASKKPFDILHPTKDGHRLRYVSLEGPHAEVYVRGVLRGTNIIDLPDYWKSLVDPESITVNLTPIGMYQELYYEIGEWGTSIKVLNSAGGSIHCSYIVYGERKDVSRNISEYKGLTPDDYPGDNSEYILK